MKMASRLFNLIKDKTKIQEAEFKAIASSDIVLQALSLHIQELIKEREKTSALDYDKASWAFHQADRNGELRAFNTILKTITE